MIQLLLFMVLMEVLFTLVHLQLNGSGTEFAAGDSIGTAGGSATISTGGVATAAQMILCFLQQLLVELMEFILELIRKIS